MSVQVVFLGTGSKIQVDCGHYVSNCAIIIDDNGLIVCKDCKEKPKYKD